VFRIVDVMHQVHRAFEAFDDLDRDHARFVKLWIFLAVISS
jgi:hypothetical protein